MLIDRMPSRAAMTLPEPHDPAAVSRTGLAGRRAIVTGASSGIGRATALLLARHGVEVVAVGRRATRLDELCAQAGSRVQARPGDLDDLDFCAALAAEAGAVDVLVNAAGVLQHAPFLEGDPAAWQSMWRTNVQSLLCLTQQVARGMAARGRGHIVNVSSILAGRVYPFTLAYAATKFAVRAISQGLRLELAPRGIKVTEVAPGLVQTEILRDVTHPDVVSAYRSRPYAPLQPDDVAQVIVDMIGRPSHACLDLVEINPAGQS
jgi:3-hydroxy acid dehydrogenase / malonic semialdehyde reductase